MSEKMTTAMTGGRGGEKAKARTVPGMWLHVDHAVSGWMYLD